MCNRLSIALSVSVLLVGWCGPTALRADDWEVPWMRETSVKKLAKKIDKLQIWLDEYGTIVSKHPDVWGDGRLTKHRVDVEKELAKDLPNFQFLLQATISEADMAFLGDAMALQAVANASNGARGDNTVTNLTSSLISADDTVNLVPRTAPFGGNQPQFLTGTLGNLAATRNIGIEPSLYLDQKNRFLQHLNELRRRNESDDTSDSPGYSLNLVRFPISILPGRKTDHGYGADINVIATPYLSEQLLPDTVKGMVINDVMDYYSHYLYEFLRDSSKAADLKDECSSCSSITKNPLSLVAFVVPYKLAPPTSTNNSSVAGAILSQEAYALMGPVLKLLQATEHPERRNNERLTPLDVKVWLRQSLNSVYKALSTPRAELLWAEYCDEMLSTAIATNQTQIVRNRRCEFLCRFDSVMGTKESVPIICQEGEVVPSPIPEIQCLKSTNTTASETACEEEITFKHLAWLLILHSARINHMLRTDMQNITTSKGCPCVDPDGQWFVGPHPSLEARMAFNEYVRCRWPVIVFALDPAIEEQNIGSAFARRRELQLAAAIAASRGLITFQKLTRFVRRMELDIATITVNRTQVGFSHGNDTFGWRFMPRIQPPPSSESNLTVITRDLLIGGPSREAQLKHAKLEPGIRDCTAIVLMPSFVPYVTFDFRSEWYRVDNPDDHLSRVTHMIPHYSRIMNTKVAVGLSEEITELRELAARCVKDADKYRDGEVWRLTQAVEQLERSLPLQTSQVQLPYDGDLSPEDLFERGSQRLAPRLEGWYGQPGIKVSSRGTDVVELIEKLRDRVAKAVADYNDAVLTVATDTVVQEKKKLLTDAQEALTAALAEAKSLESEGTQLFLVGKHFSLFNMRIIAGGVDVTDSIKLISRELCQVTIPANVSSVKETIPASKDKSNNDKSDGSQKVVDIHLATTYGLTSRLSVPAIEPEAVPSPKKTPENSAVPLTVKWNGDPEIQVCCTPDGSVIELKNGQGGCGCIQIRLESDAEEMFHPSVQDVQFAANIKLKDDKNSKGLNVGPITVCLDGNTIKLSTEDIACLLAGKCLTAPPGGFSDYDFTGFLRFPDGQHRPTYRIAKSILLRAMSGTSFPQHRSSASDSREAPTRPTWREDHLPRPIPGIGEAPSAPIDLPPPSTSRRSALPARLPDSPGAKPIMSSSAVPKPSRPIKQTGWRTTVAK